MTQFRIVLHKLPKSYDDGEQFIQGLLWMSTFTNGAMRAVIEYSDDGVEWAEIPVHGLVPYVWKPPVVDDRNWAQKLFGI